MVLIIGILGQGRRRQTTEGISTPDQPISDLMNLQYPTILAMEVWKFVGEKAIETVIPDYGMVQFMFDTAHDLMFKDPYSKGSIWRKLEEGPDGKIPYER